MGPTPQAAEGRAQRRRGRGEGGSAEGRRGQRRRLDSSAEAPSAGGGEEAEAAEAPRQRPRMVRLSDGVALIVQLLNHRQHLAATRRRVRERRPSCALGGRPLPSRSFLAYCLLPDC